MRAGDIPKLPPSRSTDCTQALLYRWDRWKLQQFWQIRSNREEAIAEFISAIDLDDSLKTERNQSYIVSGQKADFAIIMMDSDPLKIDRTHQRIMATALVATLEQAYSFVSMSEVSEYLPNKEQ